MRYPPGTLVQASDRFYIVGRHGELRRAIVRDDVKRVLELRVGVEEVLRNARKDSSTEEAG